MRRGNHSKSRASKGLVLLLALVLVFGVAVGGTVAWLTAMSDTVTNAFTTSGIEITLAESVDDDEDNAASFQMIPGFTIKKDPKVTVTATSEDCYLFVKLVKSSNFDTYLEYTIADGWTALSSENGVYYREVAKGTGTAGFSVLNGDVVTVKDTVTSTQMGEAVDNEPTLTVTAYACQLYNGNEGGTATKFEAEDAWTHAQTAAEPTNP